ncbi:MAG: hypothetical protein ACOXZ4_06585 [Sphaerochaetaceae bacterium]
MGRRQNGETGAPKRERTKRNRAGPLFYRLSREEETGRNPISVTGRLRHSSTITTIDIASITKATLLDETYTIPDNLKPFQKTPTASTFESIDTISLVLLVKEKSALNSFDTINHSPLSLCEGQTGQYHLPHGGRKLH